MVEAATDSSLIPVQGETHAIPATRQSQALLQPVWRERTGWNDTGSVLNLFTVPKIVISLLGSAAMTSWLQWSSMPPTPLLILMGLAGAGILLAFVNLLLDLRSRMAPRSPSSQSPSPHGPSLEVSSSQVPSLHGPSLQVPSPHAAPQLINASIRLSVGESGPYRHLKSDRMTSTVRTLKLRVENVEATRTLHGCKLVILAISPGQQEGPWLLQEDFPLPAGDQVFVSLVQFGEALTGSKSELSDAFIEIVATGSTKPKLPKNVEHTLTIRATAIDAPPSNLICMVWVDDAGHLRISDVASRENPT